eukprot:1579510-Amphidinium_carterae.1
MSFERFRATEFVPGNHHMGRDVHAYVKKPIPVSQQNLNKSIPDCLWITSSQCSIICGHCFGSKKSAR